MDPLPFLLVSCLSAFIGIAAGGLIVFVLRPSKGKAPGLSTTGCPPYEGVLLRHDPVSGEYKLEIDGKPISSRAELSYQEEAELKIAFTEVNRWMSVGQIPVQEQEVQMPVQEQRRMPVEPVPDTASSVSIPAASERPARVFMPASTVTPLSRPGLLGSIPRAVQADVKMPAVQRTIAQQVDEILQEMLKDSPLRQRGVRIADTPKGGLAVWVGLDQYDGVNDVPDEDVRTLLRAAVDVWKKQTE